MRSKIKSIPAALVACLATTAVLAQATASFNLPAQPLADSLRAIAGQTNSNILFDKSLVLGFSAKALKADLSVEEALKQLLSGTGLTYRNADEKTVMIVPIVSESAAVSSSAGLGSAEQMQLAQSGKTDIPVNTENTNTSSDPQKDMKKLMIEEIIVTAQKREQKLIDVPISITAIGGEELAAKGIDNMQDLSFAVPGMAVQELGPGRQLITIRGLGTEKGGTSLTGVYLDEMAVAGAQNNFYNAYIDLRTIDLERVEVLKGPQGTLFGEGSVGGTVRFVTKDPQLDRIGGDISASFYGNEGGGRSEEVIGVLNLPVVTDRFGLRIAATYENTAGWIDKVAGVGGPVIEEDINDGELVHVRIKGLWTPTEELAVKGTAIIHRSEGGGSNIVNLDPMGDHYFISEVSPATSTAYTDDYDLYNLTATYDFGFAQVLSSTSYVEMDSAANLFQRLSLVPTAAFPGGSVLEVLSPEFALDSSAFSQELRLSSTGEQRLKWTVGAFYKDDEITSGQRAPTSVLPGYGRPVSVAPVRFGVNTSKSMAVFGDVGYQLSTRMEVGAGLRYFEDDREVFNPAAVATTFLSGSFHATTFRVYSSFALTDDIRLYANAATGFRSGGFNTPSAVALGAPAGVKPEELTSYELGTKMNLLDGGLSAEFAVFHSIWSDKQGPSIFQQQPSGLLVGYTANPGEAEINGFEWAFRWRAAERLVLSFNGDITDGEMVKIDSRVANQSLFVGDPTDFTPEYSLGLSADYNLQWSPSVPGYIRLGYSEQGEAALTARNLVPVGVVTVQERTPVLNFLNASIGADWRGWALELFARNLLDEDGMLTPGFGLHSQARPRTVGLKVSTSF